MLCSADSAIHADAKVITVQVHLCARVRVCRVWCSRRVPEIEPTRRSAVLQGRPDLFRRQLQRLAPALEPQRHSCGGRDWVGLCGSAPALSVLVLCVGERDWVLSCVCLVCVVSVCRWTACSSLLPHFLFISLSTFLSLAHSSSLP